MNIKKDTIYTNKAGRVKGAGHPHVFIMFWLELEW